jgi:hypothetical protein
MVRRVIFYESKRSARVVANPLQASRTRERGNIEDGPSLSTVSSNAVVAGAAFFAAGDHHDES